MTPLRGLNADFRDLLVCLGREGAEYVLVGAYALAFHGVPRATGDIDVLVRPTVENAARVWRALVAFGAPLAAAGVQPEDFATPGLVYQIGLPPRRIDVLTEISGVSFDEAWGTRGVAELDGLPVPFLGRATLIANKRATGRLKDLADVERLESDRNR
jgi:hypothetical protein